MAESAARYTREDSDAACLVVAGDVDLANVDELTEHLACLVDDARSPAVLDLREMTFFGSTALTAVLVAHERAEAQGVQLYIRPSRMALRVIAVTGLDGVLNIRDEPDP